MKLVRFGLVSLSILFVTLGVSGTGYTAEHGTTDPVSQCAVMSWSPEMFSFYGDKATVVAKFQKLDRDLLKHRVYAFVVESNRGSRLTFFELEDSKKTMDLGTASGASFNELSSQVSTALLNGNGHKCAGQLTKELLANYEMDHTRVPRPASAGEAFQYAVAQADGEYIRATFILLC